MEKFENREAVTLETDGLKIFGVIHRPLVQGKTPAVLMCHGLAGHKTGRYRIYVNLSTALVRAGFTVLRLDYRGSGDSEGNLHDMTLEDAVKDANEGLQFLANDSLVDNRRIGFFGRSFGGAVALKVASSYKLTKSIVVWAPMFNGEHWHFLWKQAKDQKVDQNYIDQVMRINGQKLGDHFWQQYFVLNLEKEIHNLVNTPFLHIQGEKDEIIDISHADIYKETRNGAKALTKFVRLPGADHDFSSETDQIYAIEETVNWFKKTL